MTSIASDFCNATSRKMIAGSSWSSAATASAALWNFFASTPMVASVIMMSWQMPSSSSTTKARGVADPRLLGAAGASVMSSPLSVGRNQLRSSPNNLDIGTSPSRETNLAASGCFMVRPHPLKYGWTRLLIAHREMQRDIAAK